ncbi:MAG: mRNA surveillance protein pelota [Nanoarchaeota archaeon]|nr:mRNA surveillance protein pelota [Nanoarchaeota archaeon]MBU1030539.1 mRNA surveillance protein pelota [Nanoarchaeota archaeon]MBU1850759.1 mRNA surveillance protein pelota [Nanoarchaeota archaeon]
MKLIKKQLKKGELTIQVENINDLWYLSQLIEPSDFVKGKTERKIKIGSGDDRNVKVVRKTMFLELQVEKVDFHQYSEILKVLGIITLGPDDISKGSHHSFNVEVNTVITIKKEQWLKFQLERINEAVQNIKINLLIVVFDREEAYFAKLKSQGFEIIAHLVGDVQKKDKNHIAKGGFYKEIITKIEELEKTDGFETIITASPSFWKEYLIKECSEELKKKIIQSTVSSVNKNSINEVIKRPELQKALEKDNVSKEINLIEKLLKEISNDNACYGFNETKEKIEAGAVKELFVSFSYMQQRKEKGNYIELEKLMKLCENMQGIIQIISFDEPSKRLDSLSGIAGILRWKN